jgi:hypothetical protein
MPNFYDTDFARHDEAMLAQDFGERVVYSAPGAAELVDEKAIVDWEAQSGGGTDEGVVTRLREEKDGTEYARIRRFGLRLSEVPEEVVTLFGTVQHGGKDWPVTRIMGTDTARIYVECERMETHNHGAGYYGS